MAEKQFILNDQYPDFNSSLPNHERKTPKKSCIVYHAIKPKKGKELRIRKKRTIKFTKSIVYDSHWKYTDMKLYFASMTYKANHDTRTQENFIAQYDRLSNTKKIFEYFQLNPFGVADEPCSQNITERFKELTKQIEDEKATANEILQYAPPLFSMINPFSNSLIHYFNSIGPLKGDKRPSIQPRGIATIVSRIAKIASNTPPFIPSTFLPPELERMLYQCRLETFKVWYNNLVATDQYKHLQHENVIVVLKLLRCYRWRIQVPERFFKTEL